MKKPFIFILLIAITLNSYAQVSEIVIMNGDKSKSLSTENYIQLVVDIAGDSLETGEITYSGDIIELSPELLLLEPQYITTSWKDFENNSYSSESSFAFSEEHPIQIDPRTITSLYYQGNASGIISGISGSLASIGITTAMIIAPLISINYKTGAFNSDRYYKVAGAGLITFGVTLPLAILTSGRTFTFKDLFDDDNYSEGWEFSYDE